MTLREIRQQRDRIRKIGLRRGASAFWVIGSVARGEADADSDVDFLVEFEDGRSLLDLGGLQMDLADALSCPVDIVTREGLRDRMRSTVLRDAAPL